MQNEEEAITIGSIVSIGRYEILYATAPYYDEKNGEVEDIKTIQYLNNAHVRYNEVYLHYEIDWKEKGKSINAINFAMPKGKRHLQDVFITTPHGLIKKNRTGIGATTLELNSPRNSIIVVPTRALAYEKAASSKIEGESDKYRVLYVGGDITGFVVPEISDYLMDSSIRYKKFIVVADSLPRLLRIIGKEHYKDYFLMIDEIDSYQYDCSYRPNMENVMDYYFQFPISHRCLVSATIGEFSNKDIVEEPIINVQFDNSQSRNINLIHTDKAEIRLKKLIEEIATTNPDDKILIAYNSVKGCATIINSLNDNLKSECAILCSSKNEEITEYYSDIVEDRLPKRITFMTCTYFVGVDITERFHLITAINVSKPYTILSTDKLQQIAGRCRHPEGLLSETIIYTTKNNNNEMPTGLQEQVLEDAEALATFGNLYSKLKNKFPKSYYFTDELIEKDFIETTAKRYLGSSPVKLIRKNSDGIFVPSYFNIDFVRIQVDLLGRLYSTSNNLIDALKSEGHTVEVNNYIENEDIPLDIRMQTDEDFQEATMLQREDLIAKLQEEETIAARERLARNLMIQRCSRQNSLFLEHFIELQKYVPFDLLVEKLGEYDNNTDYNKFYNYVIFWILEDTHPLKTTIQEFFPINELFTGAQLTEKFNSIYSGLLNYPNLTPKKAFTLIKIFCTLSERTSMRINGRPVPAYRILNLNPFGLEGEPLERISANTSVVHLLRF
ncbi:hypothetical protein [Paraprevotella xylaniphila]|uniref:hypothetical protein n=1 Tax=Paraprevotella xylaniphila TaxID=454155 RepID=UPI00307773C4